MTTLGGILLAIVVHLAAFSIGVVSFRRWLHRQEDPFVAQYRFCGIVLVVGMLLLMEGVILGLAARRPTAGFALFPVGACVSVSTFLKRRDLAREILNKKKANAA